MIDTTSRPVRMVFTGRAAGDLSLEDTRRTLGEKLGIERQVWMEQLHTNTVTVVDGATASPVEATDAIVTTTPKLALCVKVADCVPVLLADHAAGVIAAAHAGRMGARNGIVRNTVETMVELGATPANIQALLGPAAAGESYEVPQDMADDVETHLPGSRTRTKQGTPGIDVRAGLVRQLLGLGVTHIDADPRDTITDPDFFSYRREGQTGRQAGIIWLTGA
ncbi:peptidoglycan editing factor PgeF [Corynebacterium sp. CCUG 65737]|uniref:peptidoglycan editing factor PgeF n=1 Tax=Corynebacterium sp. CCUG 65737 TaxID=2823889 RepID=UPI00210E643F|nr:peptidoglycan editing factor PgeF [Corynebacterium sp. CCUG 65737]MCQ4617849.1 peptidoglycan editing factor PgeF [Corynebacterium pseudogenitalium]MCQ4626616.1 peptidoglycan editing factor PgeF [Corynebacterium sp. CCUG 65737]